MHILIDLFSAVLLLLNVLKKKNIDRYGALSASKSVRKSTMWFPNRSDTNQAVQSQK